MKKIKIKTLEIDKVSEDIFLQQAEEVLNYASMGKISCGILHDVLNPVSGLLLFLEINNAHKDMQSIISPIIKANESIRNFIRNVSKHIEAPNQQQIINLENYIKDVMEIMSPKALSRNITISFIRKYEANLLISNSLHIYQILINLISNSIDAFEKVSDDRKRQINLVIDKDFRGNLIIRVIDNGCGIAPEDLSKIFQKNFSTKEKGTGIGLSHTQKIVEQMLDGKISVKSVPGEFTRFKITIPNQRLISN